MKRMLCGLTLCLALMAGQARAEGLLLKGSQAYALAQQLYADPTVGQPTAKVVNYLIQKLGYQLVGRYAHVVSNSDATLYEEFYSTDVYTTVQHLSLQWSAYPNGNGYRLVSASFTAPAVPSPDNMAGYAPEPEKDGAAFRASRIAGFHAEAVLGAALNIYESAFTALKAPILYVGAQTSKSGADWVDYSANYMDIAPNTELILNAGASENKVGNQVTLSNIYRLTVGTQAEMFMGTSKLPQ